MDHKLEEFKKLEKEIDGCPIDLATFAASSNGQKEHYLEQLRQLAAIQAKRKRWESMR